MRISIAMVHVGRRLGSLVQLSTVQNVCGSEQEQKNNDETSTEMRTCPFSGLPGGYPEAPHAGASQKTRIPFRAARLVRRHGRANNFDLRQIARLHRR